MSRKKNNKDPETSGNLGNSQPEQDPFEKEAAEGFDSLGSAEAIAKAKAELDARIYPEVFNRGRNSSRLFYWSAAAGLLLLIGFTVYFVNDTTQEKNLALNPPQLNKTVQRDEAPVPLPASKETKAAEKTFKPIPPSAGPAARQDKASEDQTTITTEPQFVSNGSVVNYTQTASGASAPSIAYNSSPPSGVAASEAAVQEVNVQSNTQELSQDAEVDAVVKSSANKEKMESSAPSKDYKKSKTLAQPESASAVYPKTTNISNCYYAEGETKLNQAISKLLVEKDLRKNFEARLSIDERGKVIKVEDVKSKDLSDSQKTEVAERLKQLDNFVIVKVEGLEMPAQYYLIYKP